MNLEKMGDKMLVDLYQAGNDEALSELINRYQEKVYTTTLLFVRIEILAEDLFQDTFIKVIETLRKGKYAEEGKLLPWILRIAHNLCIDHYRRIKRAPTITNSDGYDIFNVLKFAESSPEDQMTKGQTNDKVRDLIDQLPEEQKEVVVLRHYADLSFREIANITNVSINTALGRMRYALINMRRMITEHQIAL